MEQCSECLWSGQLSSSRDHSSAGSDQPTKHSDLTPASTSWFSSSSSLVSSASPASWVLVSELWEDGREIKIFVFILMMYFAVD